MASYMDITLTQLETAMAQQTPEGRVKSRVKDLLQTFDVYWFMPATGGYGSSGVPDFVCCVFGKFLAIECKAGNNRPTALQEREMDYIRQAYGTALVINEDNLDELAVYLAATKGNHHDV
jgi:hypothetical protein